MVGKTSEAQLQGCTPPMTTLRKLFFSTLPLTYQAALAVEKFVHDTEADPCDGSHKTYSAGFGLSSFRISRDKNGNINAVPVVDESRVAEFQDELRRDFG